MKQMILPASLALWALVACETASAQSGGKEVMIPGRVYDAGHSEGGRMQMKFAEDGTVLVRQDGAWVADGQRWFRRDGLLCAHGQYGGPEYAACAAETPIGTGGFKLVQDGAWVEFRPAAE